MLARIYDTMLDPAEICFLGEAAHNWTAFFDIVLRGGSLLRVDVTQVAGKTYENRASFCESEMAIAGQIREWLFDAATLGVNAFSAPEQGNFKVTISVVEAE